MFGLLNIDKPAGITSRTVVNRIQYLIRPAKTGHAGTLDPLATGVLVVAVGPATRLISYVQAMRKTYLATFLLGHQSDTLDTEGAVLALADPPQPSRADVVTAFPHFTGEIEQVPPLHSAVKVRGQPAYLRARAGQDLTLKARSITVERLDLIDYTYPHLQIRIVCSSGTYVRSLGRDLAQHLGTQAVMTQLQRTAIGSFHVADACNWQTLTDTSCTRQSLVPRILPARIAVAHLPEIELDDTQIQRLQNGQAIPSSRLTSEGEYAGLDHGGHLVAILAARRSHWHPTRIFRTD